MRDDLVVGVQFFVARLKLFIIIPQRLFDALEFMKAFGILQRVPQLEGDDAQFAGLRC